MPHTDRTDLAVFALVGGKSHRIFLHICSKGSHRSRRSHGVCFNGWEISQRFCATLLHGLTQITRISRFLLWWVENLTEFLRNFATRAHTDLADLAVFALVGEKSHRIFLHICSKGSHRFNEIQQKTIIRAIREIRG